MIAREIHNEPAAVLAPLAIAMWDFSWLERRWPGAGYEDWDQALDELAERGYNAVRIDAYPHLIAEDPGREWTIPPMWDQQLWGSPGVNKVTIQPALNQFLGKCKERGIKVGLSSWFRRDTDNILMNITSPAKMADIWIRTLDSIAEAGVLDAVMYVDLCNEWPGDVWAPYFRNDPPEATWGFWHTDTSMNWMRESVEAVRRKYPELPLTYSFDGLEVEYYARKDLSFFDFIEHHIWMVKMNKEEFYREVGYTYDRFSPESYKNLVARAEKLYRSKPDYWRNSLVEGIRNLAAQASKAGQPLITTECWGVVDYKDWPLLNWDWVKELCELGTLTAAATGQWVSIATSNFCGPQFVGMWRDVEWHQRMTSQIKKAKINEDVVNDVMRKQFLL